MHRVFPVLLVTLLFLARTCGAQSESESAFTRGVFGGGGKTGSSGAYLIGEGAGVFPRFGTGLEVELGVIGPMPHQQLDGLLSINAQPTFFATKKGIRSNRRNLFVFLNGGYSRFFVNGNGVNYGGGLIWRYAHTNSEFSGLRLEYREYYLGGWGRQPEVRISWERGWDE